MNAYIYAFRVFKDPIAHKKQRSIPKKSDGLLKLFFKNSAKLLITGLAEKRKHVLLVRFNAGLVEGVNAEHVAGNTASKLEEIEEVAEVVLTSLVHLDENVGHTAVYVSEKSSQHSGLLNGVEVNAREEVKTVDVVFIVGDLELYATVFNCDNGLEEVSVTLLNELTEGVEVGGEDYGCGENSSVILALALAVELLPPLVEHFCIVLISYENFGNLTLAVKNVSDSGILVCVVLLNVLVSISYASIVSTCHKSINVAACNRDGKKTYCGKHGETSSNVIRNNKGLVSCLGGEALEDLRQ